MAIKYAFGIDIGGTNTKLGIADSDGNILRYKSMPTPQSPPDTSAAIIADEVENLIQKEPDKEISGVGVGFPAAIIQPDGIVSASPNLPLWCNVPLKKVFEEHLKRPVYIDNDANAAALAEYLWGAGKGEDPLVIYTLGTGIGGGIVIGGKIYRGATGGGGGLGHQTIDLNSKKMWKCGNYGCLEGIAGSYGIISRTWELLNLDKGSLIWGVMGGDYGALSADMVAVAAKDGDKTAKLIAREVTRALGAAVANTINVFNPRCILIAGGMTEWGKELLLNPIIEEARKRSFKGLFKVCRIGFAKGGAKAGVLGAAGLALSEM
jgi:glucokinase